ncbi:cobyrinate a,c-diamide synthase [Polaromonas naphthalenivorans]|uniref:Cobyrinate a,c-diamide synthase / hydrogenobyrinic acid a,c-diamide synthase (Glutamine-hydrolysing) n=1 Tax=Polaromonas naphthalenivorans (strain CJ2) TaxID=365044 RepID=A1VPU6_POLNA|nr:cobyrinate a,c-diamide synthase [Polaromonas naphthalenivorans]ABM37674.1 cobyrinate a,c-diamide synthase / hydrogenobyrinic acid a,c-diamide synthase (glutamine-hydrolysing) [Polaromonas naphthalenivorans CJ2]
MARCPAILIAAPASGQGKTTVACALARLHARQGRRVRAFKCGPDFLDPYWLALASGAPVHQLDLWMTGEADCAQRLQDAALQADLIIVEGVMGLFDGQPSAADLAQRFGLKVVAVIDAGAMAGTFGALAWGLQHYREGLSFAGVLANRVASPGHAVMLEDSLRDPAQWLGALTRNEALTLPERHLGLVMDHELGDAMVRLDAATDALAQTRLGRMTADDLQAWAVDFEADDAQRPDFPADVLQGQTIAVARDAAFCFLYAANIDCLQAMGAELVYFSPLADAALPPCDALWLPGGYPELHAQTLAGNQAMKASITRHVQAGKPVWAECGGMMALFDKLTGVDGESQPMCGILPGSVTMQKRLAALGPQQLEVAGGILRGHTFHYSTCATTLQAASRTRAAPGRTLRGEGEALYVSGSVKASYFHAWFASSPAAAARLFLKEDHD